MLWQRGRSAMDAAGPRTRGIVAFDALKATQVLLPFWDLLLGNQSPHGSRVGTAPLRSVIIVIHHHEFIWDMCCLGWVILGACPILYDSSGLRRAVPPPQHLQASEGW